VVHKPETYSTWVQSLYAFQVMLHKKLEKYPPFINLKTLSIRRCLYSKTLYVDGCLYTNCGPDEKFQALARLLRKAPNLQRLTLNDCWVRSSFVSSFDTNFFTVYLT
jgi:hypothetical protein